jgi:Toxin SymE, type I toxin-antitoxin system
MDKSKSAKGAPAPKCIQNRERFLTVGIYPESALKRPIPWIRLSGLWLERAGFKVRTRIRVSVMDNCLVIIKE